MAKPPKVIDLNELFKRKRARDSEMRARKGRFSGKNPKEELSSLRRFFEQELPDARGLLAEWGIAMGIPPQESASPEVPKDIKELRREVLTLMRERKRGRYPPKEPEFEPTPESNAKCAAMLKSLLTTEGTKLLEEISGKKIGEMSPDELLRAAIRSLYGKAAQSCDEEPGAPKKQAEARMPSGGEGETDDELDVRLASRQELEARYMIEKALEFADETLGDFECAWQAVESTGAGTSYRSMQGTLAAKNGKVELSKTCMTAYVNSIQIILDFGSGKISACDPVAFMLQKDENGRVRGYSFGCDVPVSEPEKAMAKFVEILSELASKGDALARRALARLGKHLRIG